MASSRPISGSSAAISGPLSRPVSARRSGWNSALPARPLALLEPRGELRPGRVGPVDRRRRLGAPARKARSSVGRRPARHGRGGSPTSRPPRRRRRGSGRIAAQSASAMPAGSRSAHRVERQLVDDAGVERLELGHVEARRGAAEGGEIEALDQRRRVGDRLDRQAGADPGELGDQRQRLDPRLAHRLDAERAEPLGRACPPSRPAAPRARRPAAARRAPRTSAAAAPVLVTWSSPRTTWVTPISISSTTLGSM